MVRVWNSEVCSLEPSLSIDSPAVIHADSQPAVRIESRGRLAANQRGCYRARAEYRQRR